MPDTRKDDTEERSVQQELNERLRKLAIDMERGRIGDYVQLLSKPTKLMGLSFFYGIFRGAGVAVGFALVGGTLIYLLKQLGTLDLPIIGNYIAEIVKIVQNRLGVRHF